MSYLLVLGFVAAAASSAAAALTWAIKNGQFSNLSEGAASPFDDEVGDPEPRDTFPKGDTE